MTASKDILEKLSKLTDGKPVEPLGLGDSMAAVLKRFGVKPCASCKNRREVLNRIFPYKRSLFK